MADLKCYAGRCGYGLGVLCLSALSGIIAPLVFLIVMLIVEALQPGYNPIQDTISRLVLGLYGWFQTLSFFLVGFLLVVFTVRLYISMLRKVTSMVGTAFFFLSSLGFFVLGAFPVNFDETVLTPQLLVHYAAVTEAVTFFVLGCFAFAVYFRIDSQWNRLWLYTVITATMCFVFFLLWVLTPTNWQWRGLSERVVVAIGFLWVEVVSIRLLRLCFRKEST